MTALASKRTGVPDDVFICNIAPLLSGTDLTNLLIATEFQKPKPQKNHPFSLKAPTVKSLKDLALAALLKSEKYTQWSKALNDCKRKGRSLKNFTDLNNNYTIVLEAVRQNFFSLQYASDALRYNRDIVLEFVKQIFLEVAKRFLVAHMDFTFNSTGQVVEDPAEADVPVNTKKPTTLARVGSFFKNALTSVFKAAKSVVTYISEGIASLLASLGIISKAQ